MNTIAPYIPLIVLFALISIPFIIARKKSQRSAYTIVCPKCMSETTGKFSLSFLGLKSIKCQYCEKTIKLPLTWGMRISYLIVLIILAFSMIDELNVFTLLFIILILIALFNDLKAVLSNKNTNKRFQRIAKSRAR